MNKHNTESNKITKVLNDFNINEIGKTSRFCSRKRIIKPFELVMSLITALGDKSVSTVTDLHRYFVKLTETDVQYKPFHNQLSKPEFSLLMKSLVDVALSEWQQQILGTDTTLSDFKRIVLQDGSSFAVHDSLKETFKGRFTKISPVAIEVHVSWDVLKGYPEEISVSPDSQAEYDFLPDAQSLVETLFLADRGYFKLSYLESIDIAGGFYIVRVRTTVNPVVVSAYNRHGKALKRFSQKKQKDVKKHIRRSVIVDMDVEGKTNYRLIASWPKGKSEPTYWATNLSREKFSAEAVIKLYSLRWQIELLFKEWKSYCNLQKFNTRSATMMEGLVWASLLALLVKRRVGMSVQQLAGIELSTFMVAKNTQGWFYQLMESITQGVISTLKRTWQKTINFLSKYAQRANPKRGLCCISVLVNYT
ncbi:IS4 family transposase [Pseudoalteromonas sp. NBT06-2]|uniref:IS4 family transposase n=1 Tax=Pseudoalteromonas sp. NBT06-2 TaxID=2025950 RepID=UPI000BA699F5|nr:IS4 family transposase [Pseudoalteromonas sp. NBT06-2]PAJ75776.1 IS4 family transposase [Pseudoalteromonas sp. NBT06-2]